MSGNSLRCRACRNMKGTIILGAGYEKESKRLGNDYNEQKLSIPHNSPLPFPSNPSLVDEIWGHNLSQLGQ